MASRSVACEFRTDRPYASRAGERFRSPVAVCRELTKRFEEVVRGPAREVANRFSDGVKGEITLVIGPADVEGRAGDQEAVDAVSELVRAGTSRKDAADVVARLTGVSRKRLYDASL